MSVRPSADNWEHRAQHMLCKTCMWYMPKRPASAVGDHDGDGIGRCRRRSPTLNGWPVMKFNDWCGDHKLDETKLEPKVLSTSPAAAMGDPPADANSFCHACGAFHGELHKPGCSNLPTALGASPRHYTGNGHTTEPSS